MPNIYILEYHDNGETRVQVITKQTKQRSPQTHPQQVWTLEAA